MVENVIEIKRNNTMKIVNTIRFQESLTKKEMVNKIGLSFATVSNICNELREKGLISEDDMDVLSVGRSPKSITLNYNSFISVCFDFHVSLHLTIAFINLRNEILCKKTVSFSNYDDVGDFAGYCYRLYNECMEEKSLSGKQIIGVGMAVPAIFDTKSEKTIESGIQLFENQPLKKLFEDIFRIPVIVSNDSNLCAVSVMMDEEHRHIDNLVYIFCSEGVGIGVISDGKVFSGEYGYAPEICHIPIGSRELKCRLCGQPGCVQSDLSASGFIAKYLGITEYDPIGLMEKWDVFVEAVKKKERRALEVLEENSRMMGSLLSIVVNLLDPEKIYLGGVVADIFNYMQPYITEELEKRLIAANMRKVEIKPDTRDNSILTGCSEIVFNKCLPLMFL